MCSRLALAAFVAALFGSSPAFAQQPKPEAELKKAQEQLEKLLKELKDLQDKDARKAKPDAQNVPPPPPLPPNPAVPALPAATPKPMVAWAAMPPGGDKLAAIKELLSSKDPRTVALARELLEHLLKTAPKPSPENKPHTLSLELVPSGGGAKPGIFELKVAPQANAEPKTVERRVVVVGDKGPQGKPVEARFTVIGDKIGAAAGGASSLKLSADGKTAAVVSADGTVTIFDVASGKEIMKFGGKK